MKLRVSTLGSVTKYLSTVAKHSSDPARCCFVQEADRIVAFTVAHDAMAEYAIYSYDEGAAMPFAANLHLLASIAKELDAEQTVRVWEAKGNRLMHHLLSGGTQFHLCSSPPVRRLLQGDLESFASITIDAKEMNTAMRFVRHVASDENASPNLQGISIESLLEKYAVAATDGQTLAAWIRKKKKAVDQRSEVGTTVVPKQYASLLVDTCQPGLKAQLRVTDRQVEVRCGQRRAVMPTLGNFFPPWRRCLTGSEGQEFSCTIGDLVGAYRESRIGEDSRIIEMRVDQGRLIMRGVSGGSAIERSAVFDGQIEPMHVNLDAACNCLAELGDKEQIRVRVTGPGKHLVIRCGDFLLLVMTSVASTSGKENLEFARQKNAIDYISDNDSDEKFEPLPATVATTLVPGSPGKIEEMRKRLESGESIWHAADPTVETSIRDYASQLGIDVADET